MKKIIPFLIFLAACSGNPAVKEAKQVDTVKHQNGKIKMTGIMKMNAEKFEDVPGDSNLLLRDTLIDDFRFVLNNKFIVLDLNVDSNLSVGDPAFVSAEREPISLVKSCSEKLIDSKFTKLLGQKFHLISLHGKQFDASISNLKVLVEYFPNYGFYDESNPTDTLTMAREQWNYGSPYSRILVGEIDTVFSDLDSLLGAIPADLTTPEYFHSTFSKSMQEKAETDIKSTIQYQALQKNYVHSVAGKKMEGEWVDDINNEFYFSGKSKTKNQYCSLCMNAGPMCDEGFYGEITAVWKVNADKNNLEFCYPGFYYPVMYFDVDGDGIPEIFAYDFSQSPVVFKKVKGQWKLWTHLYIEDERCNC